MAPSSGVIFCIAYIAGLLIASIPVGTGMIGSLSFPWSGLLCLPIGGFLAWKVPSRWRRGPRAGLWLLTGVIGFFATVYITGRSPVPPANDLSQQIERAQAIAPTQILEGTVLEAPRLNRRLKTRFLLGVETLSVQDAAGEITFRVPTQGRAYVTAPLLQGTGLHQGQRVRAMGRLYRPQPAMNPNAFDFQAYLAKGETFSGFVAERLTFLTPSKVGLWQIQQRIVRAQVRGLGSPAGQLVSAIALGRQAVDLPFDIQDLFSQVGLAHALAASGFQVSLLLGVVLALLRSRTAYLKLGVGVGVLLGYLALTGIQPSIVRAVLMGTAALVGMAMERRVKPLGALLLAVTLMLLWNPIWIWDIGFQLSVMATLGLVVMATPIARGLPWLPVTVASLLAVPIAATLWTLPLVLYHFNTLSLISIGLNALTTPLITVLSLGGMVSGLVALVSPALGAFTASLLHYPVHLLLWLAQTSSHLPGSAIAIGQISLWQGAGLYALLGWSLRPQRALPPWGVSVSMAALILLPMGWQSLTQSTVTVLAAGDHLVWVLQDQGRTTLLNSGDAEAAFYTVQPFLKQAGVNRLTAAIAPPLAADYPAGWQALLRQTPSQTLYSAEAEPPIPEFQGHYHVLTAGKSTPAGALTIQLLGVQNPILRLSAKGESWLLLPSLKLPEQDHLANAGTILQSRILVWDGEDLSEALVQAVKPAIAICYGKNLPEFVERRLQRAGIQVFWTARDGAVTWKRHGGFHSYREAPHRNGLLPG